MTEPFLSAIVRVRGRVDELEPLVTCLAVQESRDFEILVVTTSDLVGPVRSCLEAFDPSAFPETRIVVADDASGGADLANAGLAESNGRYIALLEPGQLVTAGWVGAFGGAAHGTKDRAHAAEDGATIRCLGFERVSSPTANGEISVTRAIPSALDAFSMVEHLSINQLPLGTFAVPKHLCRPDKAWFPPVDPPACDWAFVTLAARAGGVSNTGKRTVMTAQTKAPALSSSGAGSDGLRRALQGQSLTLDPADVQRLVGFGGQDRAETIENLTDQIAMLQRQSDDLWTETERLRGELNRATRERDEARAAYREISEAEFWRATEPLRRGISRLKQAREARSR